MLLMVEKGIRGGICHAIHRYAIANNKYMKKYNKNKESSYFMYLYANSVYRWEMSQNVPVAGFESKKIWQNMMKSLYKTMTKVVIKDVFLK